MGWQLYELLTHEGRYVFIPRRRPIAVRTRKWQEAGLQWIYTPAALDQPFAFLADGEPTAPDFADALSDADFQARLQGMASLIPASQSVESFGSTDAIISEEIGSQTIRFRTRAVGDPHIIKCSYYPNWKVKGASRVYMVSPYFMLVFPQQEEIELYYGSTLSDTLGQGLTLLGAALVLGVAGRRWIRRRTQAVHPGGQPAIGADR